ncbi:hypothetical protein Sgleb_65260 [Streptomyces glebosus]|uniref:Uncharacterized protein n=1 Tax=Streptomyces glebosus TaxID=249580 RepID=A0A640T416_9ACTN|nr:hypothetical protein Sgleb_65260 [Streptomyces glebosus]GHG58964.1 hypothetical protein GCM10010513_23490 [Streptomyces glebosus]
MAVAPKRRSGAPAPGRGPASGPVARAGRRTAGRCGARPVYALPVRLANTTTLSGK